MLSHEPSLRPCKEVAVPFHRGEAVLPRGEPLPEDTPDNDRSGGGFSLQLDKVGGATHFPSALEEDVLGVGEEEFGLDVLSGGL